MSRLIRLVAAAAFALPLGCGDSPSSPHEPEVPDDDPPFQQNRGRVIAAGVRGGANGFWDPGWVFLGNEKNIAHGTGTGFVGESSLWVRDLETLGGTSVLTGVSGPANLAYSEGEDRIYWGAFGELLSVQTDGSSPDTLTTDNRSFIQVSPDGRYLLHRRWSDGKMVLVDRVLNETKETELESNYHLENDFAVFPVSQGTSLSGVGVWDLATDETTISSGIPADYDQVKVIGLGGSRSTPWISFISRRGSDVRVRVFLGLYGTGSGKIHQAFLVPGDMTGADIRSMNGSSSGDGSRLAVSVIREIVGGCHPGAFICWKWEILLFDVPSGSVSVVARGITEHGPMGLVLSPRGTRLLYEAAGSLYLVDLP